MNKQATIGYISGLLNDSSLVADNDASSIAGLRQSYPYFVPARYLDVLVRHKAEAPSPALLASVTPYLGNWLLFCDFVSGDVSKNTLQAEENVVENVVQAEEPQQIVASEANEAPVDEPEAISLADAGLPPVVASVVDEVLTLEQAEPEAQSEDIEDQANDFWFQEEEGEPVNEQTGSLEAELKELEQTVLDDTAESLQEHVEPVLVEVVNEGSVAENLVKDKPLISPVYTDDYFLQQGERISTLMPDEIVSLLPDESDRDAAKSLMVMMSFSEWLLHFKNTAEKQKEETRDQRALKTMWQKEKLAAAIEEENEEIPENVFEMAVNSIAKEDGLASEPLAEIFVKQGKPDKAIDIYRKLSLRNPQKNAYFARKIEEILKEKKS